MNAQNYTYKVSAAGRVNVIGEHVDYCGGKVFPAALSLCNTVYVRPNGTNKVRLKWTTLPDEVTLDLNDLQSAKNLKYGNYQAGSLLFMQEAGYKTVGCDMLHDCTVPFGSGLSSSAAIEVSTIAAMAALTGEEIDPVQVALLAQKAEREFTGVACGIMDQYASACGKKDHAILLDCKSLQREYIPLALGDYALVIINCKKPHNLVESKYNERRAQTEEGLKILQSTLSVDCLAEVTPSEFEKCKNLLSPVLQKRTQHVVYECDRVKKAVSAMQQGDIVRLGELLNQSHASLRDLYEVTGDELDTLAALAQSHEACVGSRMTGGGFGGCTISLVKKEAVENFKRYVCEEYQKQIGYAAECYDARIADGIIIQKL